MTAELALALPAVVLVLAVLLVTASVVSARLTCLDAARTGARVAALGEPDPVVVEAARGVAGPEAEVIVVREPPWVQVRVGAGLSGSWFTGGVIAVSASAMAWVEP